MIRVGVIGSGFGLYGHLPAFNSIKGCQVVAICGKKSERLLNYCQSIKLEKIYTDWRELLEQEELDAITIAVIPKAQYEIAKLAIHKGLHIFAEKPLALTTDQAQELVKLAQAKSITTAVDFIFPEIEQWQAAKKILDTKVLGKLKAIKVRWHFLSYNLAHNLSSWKTNIKEGGGAVGFFFSHSFYYLEYFGGQISNLSGSLVYDQLAGAKVEVGAKLTVNFQNGVKSKVSLLSNFKGEPVHQLIFEAERGKIILENIDKRVTKFRLLLQRTGQSPKDVEVKEVTGQPDEDERVKYIKSLGQRFIQACASHHQMKPDFADGWRVQQLIDLARSSRVE